MRQDGRSNSPMLGFDSLALRSVKEIGTKRSWPTNEMDMMCIDSLLNERQNSACSVWGLGFWLCGSAMVCLVCLTYEVLRAFKLRMIGLHLEFPLLTAAAPFVSFCLPVLPPRVN